jgi:YgiT-type zinc finger domain-containing protein
VENANAEEEIPMNTKASMKRPCSECGGKLQRKYITEEFERHGVRIQLSGIKAWVCEKCKEIYFLPGGAEKVVRAANCLFDLASSEEQHKGKLVANLK